MNDDSIYLVPYDEKWPELAAKEAATIHSLLPNVDFKIEHIGSTAIPGLSAKPIIDLVVGVDSLEVAKKFIEPLERFGYSFWRDNPDKSHLYFVKGLPQEGGAGRTHHVHIYEKTHDEIQKRIVFRDYLRAHPDSQKDYSELKGQLAEKFPNDREAYTNAKTDFIKSILKLAEQEPRIEHLALAQSHWDLARSPIFHRYLANYIYFTANLSEELVLRLTPAHHRSTSEVLAEVSFMDYLAKKDFPVARPMTSKNGFLAEEINFDNTRFTATVFKKIDGVRTTDDQSLNPKFLFSWGAYLAQLHSHSIAYGNKDPSEHRRPEWEFDSVKVKAESFAKHSSSPASRRLTECIGWFSVLDKGGENYGLIHGDLHLGNLFLVDGKIVSFDYDDGCRHWFLYDAAASLSSVLKVAKDESHREEIIAAFFKGYESIRPVTKQWKDRFEAFYQFRLALVFKLDEREDSRRTVFSLYDYELEKCRTLVFRKYKATNRFFLESHFENSSTQLVIFK